MGLKNLFIKEDEQDQKKSEVRKTDSVVHGVMTNSGSSISNPISTGIASDKEIETKIWEMIVAKNLPGPDYVEFKRVASGLVDVISDENLQMKGAFNVLVKSYPNFTKDTIIKSIDTYIGIVGEERDRGKSECEVLRRTKIGDKEIKVQDLKNDLNEVLRQQEELRKKNEAILKEISNLEEEIRVSTDEINKKEKTFEYSVQSVINTLESDKMKINNLSL